MDRGIVLGDIATATGFITDDDGMLEYLMSMSENNGV